MNLSEQIKSMILSGIVEEQHRKIGVEIESFYYQKGDLSRLAPVSYTHLTLPTKA